MGINRHRTNIVNLFLHRLDLRFVFFFFHNQACYFVETYKNYKLQIRQVENQ